MSSFPVKRSAAGPTPRSGKTYKPSLYENEPGPHDSVQDGVAVGCGSVGVSNVVVSASRKSGDEIGVQSSNSANRSKFMTVAAATGVGAVASMDRQSLPSSDVDAPESPGSNRARFMSNCQPLKVCCDLATIGVHNPSVRFSFEAIVLIVYPASKGPDRRHVQLIDRRGSTGITVWGENTHLFSSQHVGQIAKFSKLALVFNKGKKMLSMGRDATVHFPISDTTNDEVKWWKGLLDSPLLRVIDVHDCNDDTVVSVSGILGLMWTEVKLVKNENRNLLCLRLTDRTGFVDVRSWTHCETELVTFLERPIALRRVRVTSFAGVKVLELLDSSGTEIDSTFDGREDLEKYWQE
jgi:hypothetical protein